MRRNILVGAGAVVVIVALGVFFWARAIFASSAVRDAVAAQISGAIGQPVHIGGIGATIVPRVTMTLRDVSIGSPARVTVKNLYVGTDLGALFSRRIEHAIVRLDGARVELPLPPLTVGSSSASAAAPVRIVSVDDIALSGVDLVSGGRTLHGDVDLAVHGSGLTVRHATLKAAGTAITLTGEIADVNGPTGQLAVQADDIDVNQLMAFIGDFAGGAGVAGAAPASAAPKSRSTMDLHVALAADRATLGQLVLTGLTGQARVTADQIRLDPASFHVFGGGCQGVLAFTLGATPAFRLQASVSGVNLREVMTFAGAPTLMTGRLSGTLDVAGRGTAAASVLRTAQGSARFQAADGVVKGLGLVRGIVLATAMRADSRSQLGSTSLDQPFSRLGGQFAIGGGTATTKDLQFESKDVTLSAAGTIRLDGSAVDLAGPIQLSQALSQQAGRDLLRYTAQDGRVTLPAQVSGSADHLQVGIDVKAAAKQAITNRAKEELKKLIPKIPRHQRGGGTR